MPAAHPERDDHLLAGVPARGTRAATTTSTRAGSSSAASTGEAKRFADLLVEGAERHRRPRAAHRARPRPRRSSSSPTPTSRMRVAYFNELDTYAATHGLDTRADHRGRRARPADRRPLQQPVLRLRRLLPAQGHQAAARELSTRCRRTSSTPIVDSNTTRKDFVAVRHPRPPADGRGDLPPRHEDRIGQLPVLEHPGDHEAHQGQGRRGRRLRAGARGRRVLPLPGRARPRGVQGRSPTSSSPTATPTTSPT